MVYFIGNKEYEFVKIGYTVNNIKGRLCDLRVGCPFDLTLLHIMDGDRNTEKYIHKKFELQWVRGEWFKLSGPIQQMINKSISSSKK